MDDDLMVVERIDEHRSICVSTLARETVIDAEAGHLGDGGFFIYEVDDRLHHGSMNVLAKAVSLEAVFRMVDIWRDRPTTALDRKEG